MTITNEEWEAASPVMQQVVSNLTERVTQAAEELNHIRESLETLSVQARNRPVTPRQVVFISDRVTSRHAKMGLALKAAGWSVILLHRDDPCCSTETCFTQSFRYKSATEALLLAIGWSPVAYHIFGAWQFEVASYLIHSHPGKVVFDSYDVLNTALKPELVERSKEEMTREQFCFEQADGICCRGLVLQNLKRCFQFKIKAKKIFFPEYCLNSLPDPLPKRTDGMHLAYVGGAYIDHPTENRGYSCCDIPFIDSITGNGVHYHMYVPCTPAIFEAQYGPYRDYAARNPFFHINGPLPYEQLIRELSQFHFGVVTCGRTMPYGAHPTYNAYAHRYHLANKIFDYFDAGLGVVVYGGRFMEWIARRTGAAIVAHREELPGLLPTLQNLKDDPEFLAKIAAARERYAVQKQGQRLGRFYTGLHDSSAAAQESTLPQAQAER